MIRKAKAVWRGTGRTGNGNLSTDSGVLAETPYSFRTRFENEKGTNPEELIAAAHAGCFTMALAFRLQRAGYTPTELNTEAALTLEPEGQGFKPLAFRFERERRLGVELCGRVASALQPKCKRHGEAAGIRGGDQFFGVGTLLVFEPGSKGIRGFGEHAGVGGKISVAGGAGPAPNRFRLADHVTYPCCCVLVSTVHLR